jgi:hypothetical protein
LRGAPPVEVYLLCIILLQLLLFFLFYHVKGVELRRVVGESVPTTTVGQHVLVLAWHTRWIGN